MPLIDRFTTTPDPALAGQDLEICFENPALAGSTITVDLRNGEDESSTATIDIDENGQGCTTWPVPATGWDLIILSQSTSLDHTTPVT